MTITENLIPIGHVAKSHRFKGELMIALDDSKIRLKKPEWLFLFIDGGHVPFMIETFSRSVDSALAKLEDVSSEEQARELIGHPVFVSQISTEAGAKTKDNNDLGGYLVVDKELGEIAKVDEVMELPQQIILVVHIKSKEVLIPYKKPIVYKVDKKSKTIFVDLPVGLIEVY